MVECSISTPAIVVLESYSREKPLVVLPMSNSPQTGAHSAEGPALGFYYQALFALFVLFEQNTDNSAVGVEQLDDIQLSTDKGDLLFQLKHSLSETPTSMSIKSRAFWKTIKAWIDILDEIVLQETWLHLITVGSLVSGDPLQSFFTNATSVSELVAAMVEEAERVRDARTAAKSQGQELPYSDRADGCLGFLDLSDTLRATLCSRIRFVPTSPNVSEIEGRIASGLVMIPVTHRLIVAQKLIEWWNREVIYSLCGKRGRIISRHELQTRFTAIVGELERETLSVDFEQTDPPENYQPDGMLTRQIKLVKGRSSDIAKAIREEWRAREQRSLWLEANAGNATRIGAYDKVLKENWSDRHSSIKEECEAKDEASKETAGLNLLRWTHNDAPTVIRPIDPGLSASYYVRGSMQILAVNLEVGWHPEYEDRLNGGTK